MSGGKGGSQKSKVEIPDFIMDPARRNINRAEALAQVGYIPYYGPEVAALSPMQLGAMQSTADAATAFGLAPQMDVAASLPQAQDFGGGMMGYGSGDLFQNSVNQFAANNPAQYAQFSSQFTGPTAQGAGMSPYRPVGPLGGYNPGNFSLGLPNSGGGRS